MSTRFDLCFRKEMVCVKKMRETNNKLGKIFSVKMTDLDNANWMVMPFLCK